jgi:hypothetical protein
LAVRLVPPREAQEGAFRGGPEWRRYNSDDGSQGTASMASTRTIQASCQTAALQKDYLFQCIEGFCDGLQEKASASKICDSLNYCAAHKN